MKVMRVMYSGLCLSVLMTTIARPVLAGDGSIASKADRKRIESVRTIKGKLEQKTVIRADTVCVLQYTEITGGSGEVSQIIQGGGVQHCRSGLNNTLKIQNRSTSPDEKIRKDSER